MPALYQAYHSSVRWHGNPLVSHSVRAISKNPRQPSPLMEDSANRSGTPCHGVVKNTRPGLASGQMRTGARQANATEIQRRLGRAVRSARLANSLTQEEIARRSGFGWRHIQKIEAGEVNATLRTICKLAAAVGVDPGALLSEPDGE